MQEKKPIIPQDRQQEQDDFWDIDRLLPSGGQKRRTISQPTKRSTQAIDIDVPAPLIPATPPTAMASPFTHTQEPRKDHGGGAYPTHHGDVPPEEPTLVYEAEGRLLHTVKVYTWRTNYHYFDQFIGDATKYAAKKGERVNREPFFSYFPQYAQMSCRQLAWYLWWRDNARQGVYLETDYAYVLLYLFELLNLPAEEQEVAQNTRDIMANLWMVYRKAYPQLDHYMCEWLCDYCLIHQLTAPVAILLPALSQVIATARLKEFYLSAMIAVGDESVNLASARVLLAYCCQYDYRKSKFASGEHKALFDTLIPGAVAATFPMVMGRRGEQTAIVMDDSYISRDAYVGALCGYSNKRRIEIAYTSFSRSHDLRFLIGDMVRHIENRIRGALGVRSKLTTHFLTTPIREALDNWLKPRLPKQEVAVKNTATPQPRPEYEAFYDAPSTQISVASADEIEKASWETTRILTEAFADEGQTEGAEIIGKTETQEVIPPDIPVTPPIETQMTTSELLTALGDLTIFFKAALVEDREGQRAYCQTHHKLPDAVADEINDITTTYEIFDMVLENTGNMYTVIEDYKEIINNILNN